MVKSKVPAGGGFVTAFADFVHGSVMQRMLLPSGTFNNSVGVKRSKAGSSSSFTVRITIGLVLLPGYDFPNEGDHGDGSDVPAVS
jgi:hypothetical protein